MEERKNRYQIVQQSILLFTIAAGVFSIVFWMNTDPGTDIVRMDPGLDHSPERSLTIAENVFGEYRRVFTEMTVSDHRETWPGFRGPDRSGINQEETPLANHWGEQGPVRLWEVSLGDGHAAAAVSNGYVYVLDYDEELSMDMLRCFELESGTEIWRTGYSNSIKRNHGRSRSIPYVTEESVISMGPQGHLMAVKAEDGSLLWGKNLANEYLTEIPLWYTAQCPIVVNGAVLTAVCGQDVLITALDAETGEPLWSIPNDQQYTMSHASIIPVNLGGVPHYVYAALGGIVGFTGEGELLWSASWEPAVVAPSPVQTADNLLFLTAGYGVGSMVLRVDCQNGVWEVEKIQQRLPSEALACEQQTPVFYQGRLYGILPKDAGPNREEFSCADEQGNLLWTSGSLTRFGLGPWIIADGKFLVLNETAELFMADASADEWQVLDSARILEDGADAWGPLALAGGFLLLRDSHRMVCLDLREELYR